MAATDSGFSDYLPLVRPLDEEQARLVEILVAAQGSEVSFEELRRQGIENPAVLAYELEIAGLPITHVQRPSPGGRASAVGLRLDSTLPLEIPSQERARAREPLERSSVAQGSNAGNGRNGRATQRGAPRPPRDLAPAIAIALAALVLVVIIVALASSSGSGSGKGGHGTLALRGSHAAQPTPAPNTSAATPPSAAERTHRRKASHASRPAPAPPLSHAAQLQQAGHLLLAEGRYAAAIPELRAALSASGESASGCSESSTAECTAYAEALYDLGRALRLDNAHAAAGAVLRERLRISSQHDAVQHELGLNRRQRHGAPPSPRPAHSRTPRSPSPPRPAPTPHPITGGASAPAP